MTWLAFAATTPLARVYIAAQCAHYRRYSLFLFAFSEGRRTVAVPWVSTN